MFGCCGCLVVVVVWLFGCLVVVVVFFFCFLMFFVLFAAVTGP